MCLYPRFIKNQRYTKTKKNGGIVPAIIDRRIEYTPIGCKNCIECRKQKANEWKTRLSEDIRTHTNGQFVTLTFSNESIKKLLNETIKRTDKETGKIITIPIKELTGYDKDNAIATKAIRLFTERWRKHNKSTVRHWLITELGHKGTENIHLHGIIWCNDHNQIKQHWQYGFVWDGYNKNGKRINYVNEKTINYIIKYCTKIDQRNKEYKQIILCSKGIGSNYTNTTRAKTHEFKDQETNEIYKTRSGHKVKIPIYWRNKIYTDHEKERLWIQKLDKEERWICGTKFDISKGTEAYDKEVQWWRKRNATLGYGGIPNENRKQYENERREIMIITRIKKAKK